MVERLFPHISASPFGIWLVLWVGGLFLFAFFLLAITHRFNLRQAIRSRVGIILGGWLLVIPIYLVAMFSTRPLAALFVATILTLALREVFSLMQLPRRYRQSIYLLTFVTVFVGTYAPDQYLALPLLYFLTLTTIPVFMNDVAHGLERLALAMLTLVWIVFFGGHIILLGHLDSALGLGRALLGGVVLAVCLSDIGAFVAGKVFTRSTLAERLLIAPAITPNKHWLGLLGHVGGAALGLAIASPFLLTVYSASTLAVLAIWIGFLGMLGGLMNSLMKRTYGAKDSGTLLPGHGGVLDRIDSLVRVAGGVYYFLLFLN